MLGDYIFLGKCHIVTPIALDIKLIRGAGFWMTMILERFFYIKNLVVQIHTAGIGLATGEYKFHPLATIVTYRIWTIWIILGSSWQEYGGQVEVGFRCVGQGALIESYRLEDIRDIYCVLLHYDWSAHAYQAWAKETLSCTSQGSKQVSGSGQWSKVSFILYKFVESLERMHKSMKLTTVQNTR